MNNIRLDVLLVRRGLLPSRQRAKELIEAGGVAVDGAVIAKPSSAVSDTAEITLSDVPRYVGRGYLKLAHAAGHFSIDVAGRVCLDVGASTGGFTQYLLERGAVYVYAADTGHGQLHPSLSQDRRVANLEGTDIRTLSAASFDRPVDFAVIDVSFIPLTYVLPYAAACLTPTAQILALIKPQFQAGRQHVGKNGVVKDEKARQSAVTAVLKAAAELGLAGRGVIQSPITGGDGNIEYFACFDVQYR